MFLSAGYRAIYLAILFFASLILANLLLPSYFGILSLMIINASIVSLVTGLGADSLIMYSLANNQWSFSYSFSFMWTAIGFQLFFFTFLQGITLSVWNITLLMQYHTNYLVMECLFFTGLILTEKYLVLYYSSHKAQKANFILLIGALIYISILLFLQQSPSINFPIVLNIVAFQSFFQGLLLVTFFHLKEKRLLFEKINWKQTVQAFKVSSVVMFTNVIQMFAYRIDFWLIEKFHTTYEVGIYAQTNKLANLMWVIPNIFALLFIPKFGQMDKDKIPVVFRVATLSNILLALATLVITRIFYAYFLAMQYSKGINAFYLMMPGYFFWATVIYFGAYFSWMGKFHVNLICSSFCFICILISDLLLIPRYSIQGAAISNTIAYTLTFALYLFFLTQKSSFTLSKISIPEKNDFYFLQKVLK